jgi:hypothetical protein
MPEPLGREASVPFVLAALAESGARPKLCELPEIVNTVTRIEVSNGTGLILIFPIRTPPPIEIASEVL